VQELVTSAGGAFNNSTAKHTAGPPADAALRSNTPQPGQSATSPRQDTGSSAAADPSWQEYVGDEDGSEVQQGGGVGVAPAGARPSSSGAGAAEQGQPSTSAHSHMPAPDRWVTCLGLSSRLLL
jgi:hypothetical protein